MDSVKRYERLGLPGKYTNVTMALKLIQQAKELYPYGRYFDSVASVCSDLGFLAKSYWLADNLLDALKAGEELIVSTEKYFMGDWQTIQHPEKTVPATHDTWRVVLNWHEQARDLLAWASVLGRWQDLARISQFFQTDMKPQPGEMERDYFVVLGQCLRDGLDATHCASLENFASGRNKGLALEASCLKSVLQGDSAGFTTAFNGTLRHWKRRDWKLDWGLCAEGTFFYHFALSKGMSVVIPEGFEDHLAIAPQKSN